MASRFGLVLVVVVVGASAGLLLAALAAPAFAQGISFPAGPAGTVWIWEPQKSVEGELQADPRLDQRVKFWRAGLTLPEVFAGVREQTGVEIRFWPQDDLNTRVRVNLFLSPEHPLSLRGVMTQLVWVTECAFAFADEPRGRTYYMLSVATTADARAKMAVVAIAAGPDKRLASIRQTQRAWQEDSLARAQVYAHALALPREELIAQYRGRDDYLLYNLLEPKRRAAFELTLGLPQRDQEALIREESRIERSLNDWDPRSRALIETIFSDEPWWGTGGEVRIVLSSDGLMSSVGAQTLRSRAEGSPPQWQLARGDVSWGWPEESEHSPQEEVALRRLLGEQVSPEEETAYVTERSARIDAEAKAQALAKEGEREESNRSLSEGMIARLSRADLPLHFPDTYMLCELQEAVARAASVSVVSDSFCDIPRAVRRPGDGSSKTTPMSALEALSIVAYPRMDREELLADWEDMTVGFCLGWDWGNAGSVLRFRSLLRDIWRASFLPPDVVERMDSWARPYLTPEAMAKRSMWIPVDPYEVLWVAGRLDTSQARYGSFLIYGNPASAEERWLSSFRYWVVKEIAWKPIYGLLSTLSPKQWELARGDGIRMGYDLSSSQRALASESLSKLAWTGPLKGELADCTMRVSAGPPEYVRRLGLSDKHTWHLEFLAKGQVVGEATIMEQSLGRVTKTGLDKAREAEPPD